MRQKIGERLVQSGLISEHDLNRALEERRRTGDRLGLVLVRLNLATERQVAESLALQLGFPYVDLALSPPEPSAIDLIPRDVSLSHACVGLTLESNVLTVAMADPLLFSLVQDLEFQTGCRIRQVVSTGSQIADAIRAYYPEETPALGSGEQMLPSAASPERRTEAERMMEIAAAALKTAAATGASAIHIEPSDTRVLIRHRLDGQLKTVEDLPRWMHPGLVAHFKGIAGMDRSETRLPQSGLVRVTGDDGGGTDFRVSTLRTVFGEKLVMRVFGRAQRAPDLDDLGMSAIALQEVRALVARDHGLILAAGPAGCGRSTTHAAALKLLHAERTNIVTIEDPVAYEIPGVNQTQLDPAIGLTYANAFRSVLEHDPDVILVGELRDAETAALAVRAAERGCLVLSSVTATDGSSVLSRLTDMGIEGSAIAACLAGVVAQRLVRRLCPHCRCEYMPSSDTLARMNIPEEDAAAVPFYKAVGCDLCNHTGYRGRIGIFEVMTIGGSLRRLIATGAPGELIRDAAIAAGMIGLGEDGVAKVKAGVTTPEELLRVVSEVRPVRTLCAGCGAIVGSGFVACAQCGRRVNSGCPHCGRSMEPGWHFCPYCARVRESMRPTRPGTGAVVNPS